VRCSACGTENEPGRKFCLECGSLLAVLCSACGSANNPRAKFCGECGTALAGTSIPQPAAATASPSAERRLVSVLFADLVGFTSLSESRDAEEVRELLSGYFDTCRRLISLYGGTVEKFIGDAVMAVWGTPVAQEDDAERAVRTALDLMDAVAAMGEEIGAPALRARAGVLTGEAAVTLAAQGEGMVAGDLVNTASRIQSAAPPGQVFVGEATRRSTEAAIVYEEAGPHELKGKAEPVPLWRAVRVVAARGGALKSIGLEPPFVGRDRELRLVKDLFHTSAEQRKAHLVSVMGIGGIGKSRLSWEFYKYIDGLSDTMFWHRGRCLSYGEGVTYWALAEMVRMRAGIAEAEDPSMALEKLRACVEQHVPDPDERRWVEPRLAHLLGLEERTARDREDLFGAWRLFFERLAEVHPTILVFEDLHWADPSMLEFVEYLLDWSRNHPVFVMTLARPELAERHPNWGAAKRNFTSLYLEPLSAESMERLLSGLVPGLPQELRERILARAEGVPLYAVETVRMLLDRGLLVRDGNEYRPAGAVESLEVPETLHALIAARLDGLTVEERRLAQDASVLGKTSTKPALSAISGSTEEELEPILASLVRKEILSIQADPRSPERGQYGFLQDLVRTVAHDTLSRHERKARHLAAAAYLEQAWRAEEDEIAEVVASHYLEAYRSAPDADDAGGIRARAKAMLERAGERAASLAAGEEAARYFQQAAELSDEPEEVGNLLERAGRMEWRSGRTETARAHLTTAIEQFESAGLTHAAARATARLGEIDFADGRLEESVERMERAFAALEGEELDEDTAMLAAQLARVLFFAGRIDDAAERIERALDAAEGLMLPEVLSQGLITKAIIMDARGRHEEARVILQHALQVALDHDLPQAALRAYRNLGATLERWNRYEEEITAVEGSVELARRYGDRLYELTMLAGSIAPLIEVGRWEEALARAEEIRQSQDIAGLQTVYIELMPVLFVLVQQGDVDAAAEMMKTFETAEHTEDIQVRGLYLWLTALMMAGEGRHEESLAHAERSMRSEIRFSSAPSVVASFAIAVESALALAEYDRAAEIIAEVEATQPGHVSPALRAQWSRLSALLAVARADEERVEPGFKAAAGLFRELGMPFWLAVSLLQHGEWLASTGRLGDAEPLLAEARDIFERLKARPWLERLAMTAGPIETGALA
jgi:class 3 adenylate cyclase/tetratricopeptide (TPR) repeat protein